MVLKAHPGGGQETTLFLRVASLLSLLSYHYYHLTADYRHSQCNHIWRKLYVILMAMVMCHVNEMHMCTYLSFSLQNVGIHNTIRMKSRLLDTSYKRNQGNIYGLNFGVQLINEVFQAKIISFFKDDGGSKFKYN